MKQFLGNYRGKVLDNTGTMGKCKIYVPSIYPNEIGGVKSNITGFASKLPWAEPAMSIFGGSTDNKGICCWPDVGATVWVFFEGGDIRYPVYFASIPGGQAWIAENNKQYTIQTEKTKININDLDGSVNISVATLVYLETPNTKIKGDLELDGNLHTTGNIKSDAEVGDSVRNMSEDRIIFNIHKHKGNLGQDTSTPLSQQ